MDKSNHLKEEIINTFKEMAIEHGLRKTNLDEVSKALKISKKTIYKYYRSKDEMVYEVVDKLISDITKIAQDCMFSNLSPVERYIDTFTYVGKYLMGINQRLMEDIQLLYPELWKRLDEIRAEKTAGFLEVLREGVKNGCFKNINIVIATQIITSSISKILNPLFLKENSIDFEEAINNLKIIFLEGILRLD